MSSNSFPTLPFGISITQQNLVMTLSLRESDIKANYHHCRKVSACNYWHIYSSAENPVILMELKLLSLQQIDTM